MTKMKNDLLLGASFRDPNGFIFHREGVLFRQVNQKYQQNYDLLFSSGLYEELVNKGLLVRHEEVSVTPADPSSAYKVICPEIIPFISYPYEWSFSQLKDAALATLSIQRRALKKGMTLKDSSAYNIQFRKGRPVLIDTLSFEAYQEGKPWVAYRQFCQQFLAPLALMSYQDVRLSQLLRVYIDGVPLDLASRLLRGRTPLKLGLYTHIHLHASLQHREAGRASDHPVRSTGMSHAALEGLVESLRSEVRKLKWEPKGTEWGKYYETDSAHYSEQASQHKKEIIGQFLKRLTPQSAWDLGANRGLFSRIASQGGIPTVAFDIDPAAVEQNYLACKAGKETQILPLVLDLTNPSPAIGWNNAERMSLLERGPVDVVLALALVHHLAISNNVPLPKLAEFFHHICRWLIIEFVPKSDSQVQILLASREDIFPGYTIEGFEATFGKAFNILEVVDVRETQRKLYLMEAKEIENP